ncbi:MAG: hypothetical protein H0X40_08255 [Chthoniobacterales bacterium]|nr:hypothetical protein [Chthoniobacterales bacterium]
MKLVLAAGLLFLPGLAEAQEIRRALPVEQSSPPPEIRRAVPVNPAPPPPTPTSTPVPRQPVAPASVNDTAHFLAGLPISENSSLVPLTHQSSWQQHANFFNQAWAKLEARQLSGIRTWETSYLPEARDPVPVVYYLFSGPDFLYADQFFPSASSYILAGTEPIGPLPDVTHFGDPALDSVLHNLQTALNSVLSFSFFITKDMKTDLQREELKGTLPIFYVFLARAGKTITDITFLTLDKNGDPQIATSPGAHGTTPGVRITFTGEAGSAPQTLYYFTTDLSDEGIRSHPGFLKFCAAQSIGDSLLKSASYLMFEPGFVTVRNFLLTHSKTLIQDDSGIPITAFDQAKWNLRFFGSYSTPIDLFKQHFQPELQALYIQSHPPPLTFGIGYRWSRTRSTLIVAEHK